MICYIKIWITLTDYPIIFKSLQGIPKRPMKETFLLGCFLILHQFGIASGVLKDTTDNGDDKASAIVVGGQYSTNTNTFGRFDKFATQPSYSPYLTYNGKHNLQLGAAGNFIENSDATASQTTSELDLQAGYSWELSDKFSIAPSYTHFFFSSNSDALRRSYSDYLQLSLNTDLKWWNCSLSGKYLWGTFDETLLTAETGFTITINNVLHHGNTLVIAPFGELNISNINYFRYVSGEYKFLREYATLYPDKTVNDLIYDLQNSPRPLIRKLADRIDATRTLKKRLNLLTSDSNFVISQMFNTEKAFKISNLGLTLPVYYYWGNFTLTATFAAYKPFNQPKMFGNDWVTYFGVGLSYTFNFHGQNSF